MNSNSSQQSLNERSEYGEIVAFISNTNTEDLYNWLNQYNYEQHVSLIRKRLNKVCFLTSINIKEKYRGQGHGSKLLNTCIFKSKNCGAEAIILVADVYENNKFNLIRWYEKNGFKTIDDEEVNPLMILRL